MRYLVLGVGVWLVFSVPAALALGWWLRRAGPVPVLEGRALEAEDPGRDRGGDPEDEHRDEQHDLTDRRVIVLDDHVRESLGGQ
jgi:hypothetical protein